LLTLRNSKSSRRIRQFDFLRSTCWPIADHRDFTRVALQKAIGEENGIRKSGIYFVRFAPNKRRSTVNVPTMFVHYLALKSESIPQVSIQPKMVLAEFQYLYW
jgi:hypothetical protein